MISVNELTDLFKDTTVAFILPGIYKITIYFTNYTYLAFTSNNCKLEWEKGEWSYEDD